MALYFCNPMTLMGGEILCSPYRNMQQTDSRTGLFHLGEKKRPLLPNTCFLCDEKRS